MLIVRSWRGYAAHSNPNAYPAHFRNNVMPELREIGGFLGARLLKSASEDGIEFLVLTRWRSMDAIRAFAGEDLKRAVVEPEAVCALTRFDERVRHYEVVEDFEDPGLPLEGEDNVRK
jgi:heme-degrading monooxygenase HmoA